MAGTRNSTCKGPGARENLVSSGGNALMRAGEWNVVGIENCTGLPDSQGAGKAEKGFNQDSPQSNVPFVISL